MENRIDRVARRLAQSTKRRDAVKGLSALGLGALGFAGAGNILHDNVAEAKSCKRNKDCPDDKKCKHKKKDNNGKRRGHCR